MGGTSVPLWNWKALYARKIASNRANTQKRPSACINQYLFIKASGIRQSYSGQGNIPVQSQRESAAQSQAAASAGSAGTDMPKQLATDGNDNNMSCRRSLKIDPNKVVCGFSTFQPPSYSGGWTLHMKYSHRIQQPSSASPTAEAVGMAWGHMPHPSKWQILE